MSRTSRKPSPRSNPRSGRDTRVSLRDSVPRPFGSDPRSLVLYGGETPAVFRTDRRFYNPDSVPQAFTLRGLPARVKPLNALKRPLARLLPHRLTFTQSHRVLVCIRRKMRSQVLHAKNIAGRRGLSGGKRNSFSNISCR